MYTRFPCAPAYTISSKYNPKIKFQSPSPCQYSPKQGNSGPAWLFGAKSDSLKNGKEDLQNTQAYSDLNQISGISARPKGISFTKSQRSLSLYYTGPGPGYYDIVCKPSVQPVSFKDRCASSKEQVDTRPHSYFAFPNSTKLPIKFSQAVIKNIQLTSSVGPGDYQLRDTVFPPPPHITFKKASRVPLAEIDQTPGPATYYKPQIQPTRTLAWKKQQITEITKKTSPGPGDYEMKGCLNSKCAIFSKEDSKGKKARHEGTPGPGSYLKQEFSISNRFPALRKPQSTIVEKQEQPGPGYYNVQLKKSSSFKFSKTDKLITNASTVPGPTDYRPTSLSKEGGLTFSKSKKDLTFDNHIPGPAEYFKQHATKPQGLSFGRERRSSILMKQGPGPADYKIPQFFGQTVIYKKKKGKEQTASEQ